MMRASESSFRSPFVWFALHFKSTTLYNSLKLRAALHSALLCLAMSNDKSMTVEEVAEAMRTHPETIRRWLRRGLFPHARKTPSGHSWRIPRADVDVLNGAEIQDAAQL
jgi:excisionase family DNA binding protein